MSDTLTNAAAAVSPGPSWAADWPPFSSKHRERLARPPMPDRQHSAGMLDEEEDTRHIDVDTVKREDLVRILRDIRDDFVSAFHYIHPYLCASIPSYLIELGKKARGLSKL